MELVKCSKEYWEFVRLLRMDSRVVDGFVDIIYITEDMQISYMKKYADCYRIALVNGNPAGYVGVIDNDIRVCTHPDFQKMGVGKFMINECMKIWPKATARIKLDNTASVKLFEYCGFNKKYYLLERG